MFAAATSHSETATSCPAHSHVARNAKTILIIHATCTRIHTHARTHAILLIYHILLHCHSCLSDWIGLDWTLNISHNCLYHLFIFLSFCVNSYLAFDVCVYLKLTFSYTEYLKDSEIYNNKYIYIYYHRQTRDHIY